MRIVEQSYEILTDISDGGLKELKLIETAGRTAYKSEVKDHSDEDTYDFIRRLIENSHESVLEHSLLTVRFITDRGVTHELVRHRLCAFTQESTRYCNYSKGRFGHEITVIQPHWVSDDPERQIDFDVWENWTSQCLAAENAYMNALSKGQPPQLARDLLPTCTKAEIIVSANYREWRHILKLRTAKDAHPQMRALMIPLLAELKARIPVIFDDIEY